MAPDTAPNGGQDRIPTTAARRVLIRLLLPPFFLAGEWWVRYTERIAAEQEARHG